MRKFVYLMGLLVFSSMLAIAQTRAITGKVLDETGQPIGGTSITVKGSTTGTSADANGNFKINAKTGDVLVVTGVSIPLREVIVTSKPTLVISITRESQSLSE